MKHHFILVMPAQPALGECHHKYKSKSMFNRIYSGSPTCDLTGIESLGTPLLRCIHPLNLPFFLHGPGSFILISESVKDLGSREDDTFSSASQRNASAKNARRMTFVIRLSFKTLSKIAFIQFNAAHVIDVSALMSGAIPKMLYISHSVA